MTSEVVTAVYDLSALAGLTPVQLRQRRATPIFVIKVGQRMQGFVNAAKLGQGLRQPGRVILRLERAHNAGGRYLSQLERAYQP